MILNFKWKSNFIFTLVFTLIIITSLFGGKDMYAQTNCVDSAFRKTYTSPIPSRVQSQKVLKNGDILVNSNVYSVEDNVQRTKISGNN